MTSHTVLHVCTYRVVREIFFPFNHERSMSHLPIYTTRHDTCLPVDTFDLLPSGRARVNYLAIAKQLEIVKFSKPMYYYITHIVHALCPLKNFNEHFK